MSWRKAFVSIRCPRLPYPAAGDQQGLLTRSDTSSGYLSRAGERLYITWRLLLAVWGRAGPAPVGSGGRYVDGMVTAGHVTGGAMITVGCRKRSPSSRWKPVHQTGGQGPFQALRRDPNSNGPDPRRRQPGGTSQRRSATQLPEHPRERFACCRVTVRAITPDGNVPPTVVGSGRQRQDPVGDKVDQDDVQPAVASYGIHRRSQRAMTFSGPVGDLPCPGTAGARITHD